MQQHIKRLFALGLLIWLLFGGAAPAQAHANLVRSVPAIGATLAAPPPTLVLEFSEAPDPAFSRVQLFNSANELVVEESGVIDPAEPHVLRLDMGDLPNDTYTAIWRVRSTVDGHVTEGNVPFGVGVSMSQVSLLPPVGTPDPATALPSLTEGGLRWLTYLTATVAFGAVLFGLFVWQPVVRASNEAVMHQANRAMLHIIRPLVMFGGAAFVVTQVLFLLQQAQALVSPEHGFGSALIGLATGRSGLLWAVRVLLTLLVVGLIWRLPLANGQAIWRVAAGLVMIILLTFSLNGHAAATPRPALAVAAIWLHIVTAVIWLGGLLPLAWALLMSWRGQLMLPIDGLVGRFSRVALASVGVLALSGSYTALEHVQRLELLPATTYGRALLVKIGLFAVLLTLAAANLLLSPRLRTMGNRAVQRLGGIMRAELLIGAAVLLAAGAMTSVAPSASAWAEQQRQGKIERATVEDVQLALRVAPGRIGDNEFAVDVIDQRANASDRPATVLLNFGMIGMQMGQLQTETTQTAPQRYVTRGSYTAMGGRWQIEVIVRRDGIRDVRHIFEIDILDSPVAGR